MKRREFVSLFPLASLPASDTSLLRAPFPSLAHQLVWRNWDLVPAERIARALGCPAPAVARMAADMLLPPQKLAPRYAHRQRFLVLRRNWYFVPMVQLTILAQMPEAQITSLLAEDAFYAGHLGPKPNLAPVAVPRDFPKPSSDFRILSPPHAETRFDFGAAFARDMPEHDCPPLRAGPPDRIAFPYAALYGDVLSSPDFDSFYPDVMLRGMKRLGITGIWLHGLLRDLTRHPLLPGYGTACEARLARLNRLIARCAALGMGAYLYLNEPRAMPSAFFAPRPELKGDEGRPNEGLTSLCMSTAPVRQWLREATRQLVEKAPRLRGLILITASENATNCYSLRRKTNCPRCRQRTPQDVIAEVVTAIRDGARSVSPEIRIHAWDWSWGVVEDDPQDKVIAALPGDVTLQVDFERGTPARRLGRDTLIDEYSLSIPGPSPRARNHIAQAKSRGMPVAAKVQIGNSWELSLLPFLPVPDLVARKCLALREAQLDAVMLSWTLGSWPSPNWLVVRESFAASTSTADEILDRVAAERYGARNVPGARRAWSIFSRAFADYPYSNQLVYSSVVQQGPAHPLWLSPSGRRSAILNSFDSLSWTSPYPPADVAAAFRHMAAEWKSGVAAFAPVAGRGGPRAAADQRVHLAGQLYFESIANQIDIHRMRDQLSANRAEIRRRIEHELQIAEAFLPLCEADARFGFEASLQYFYMPQDVREKILWCRAMREQLK